MHDPAGTRFDSYSVSSKENKSSLLLISLSTNPELIINVTFSLQSKLDIKISNLIDI